MSAHSSKLLGSKPAVYLNLLSSIKLIRYVSLLSQIPDRRVLGLCGKGLAVMGLQDWLM